jgi:hypothetical protein
MERPILPLVSPPRSDGWASFVAGEAVECPATVTRINDRRRGQICRHKLCVVGPGTIARVRVHRDAEPEMAIITPKCPACGTIVDLQVLVAIAELVA